MFRSRCRQPSSSFLSATSFSSCVPRFCFARYSSSSNNNNNHDDNHHVNDDDQGPDFASMQTINSSDAFAKPRVTNYLKRFSFPSSGFTSRKLMSTTSSSSASACASACSQNSPSWYRCESRVPIFFSSTQQNQHPERVATAIGFGKSEKEAENACAMHAERILDAAGAELFSLGAMQARHAEAAFKEGRWARFPKNHPKRQEQDEEAEARRINIPNTPPLICTPLGFQHAKQSTLPDAAGAAASSVNSASFSPFSSCSTSSSVTEITFDDTRDTDDSELQHEGIEIDKAEVADWRIFPLRQLQVNHLPPPSMRHLDESEGGKYWLVEFGMYYENEPLTLLSAHVFCPESMGRVQKYCEYYAKKFDDPENVTTETMPLAAWSNERVTLFKKKVTIPVDSSTPARAASHQADRQQVPRVIEAIGVAKEESVALQLCAMHAELLIDYHGLQLFPYDAKLQDRHADECRRVGRWAVSSSSSARHPKVLEPPKSGLREWGETTKPKGARSYGRSVQQQRRIAAFTEEEFFLHCHARNVRPYHLLEVNPEDLVSSEEHGHEGEKLFADLRQLFVDLGEPRELYFLNYDYGSMWRCTFLLPLDMKTYGIRGGYGLGFTEKEARFLAALHAVETLSTFGLPLYLKDKKKQAEFERRRRARGYFVADRDPETGEVDRTSAPSPRFRSPPGFRSLNNWRRNEKRTLPPSSVIRSATKVPGYDEWRAAQMIDASVFAVVDTSSDKYDVFLTQAFENYLTNIDRLKRSADRDDDDDGEIDHEAERADEGDANERAREKENAKGDVGLEVEEIASPSCKRKVGAKQPLLETYHYFGLQPVKGHFLVASNTCFASIPLPPGPIQDDNFQGATTIYAVGRDEDRRQALRNFYVHAMRIIDSLGLLHLCVKHQKKVLSSNHDENHEDNNHSYNNNCKNIHDIQESATAQQQHQEGQKRKQQQQPQHRSDEKPEFADDHDLETLRDRVYKCFDAIHVPVQTVQANYGAAANYHGKQFTWGNSFHSLYPPLRPLDKDGKLVQSANMAHVPPPCIGTIISERCYTQTDGAKKHLKFKCA